MVVTTITNIKRLKEANIALLFDSVKIENNNAKLNKTVARITKDVKAAIEQKEFNKSLFIYSLCFNVALVVLFLK